MALTSIVFGSGDLIAKVGIQPVKFGTLQDVEVNFNQATKELYGKNRFPVGIANTELKVTFKAKAAQFNAALYTGCFFGGTVTTGELNRTAPGEAQTPASGTFTVTNGATFVADLGVFDTVTLEWMTTISSGTPTTGQYKYSAAGVYTVPSGDTNPKYVWYTYTTVTGSYFKIPNIAMGANTPFSLYLSNGQWQAVQIGLVLYACGANKMTMGFKNTDWMIPEFDGYAYDNGTGYIGEIDQDVVNFNEN